MIPLVLSCQMNESRPFWCGCAPAFVDWINCTNRSSDHYYPLSIYTHSSSQMHWSNFSIAFWSVSWAFLLAAPSFHPKNIAIFTDNFKNWIYSSLCVDFGNNGNAGILLCNRLALDMEHVKLLPLGLAKPTVIISLSMVTYIWFLLLIDEGSTSA